MIQDSGTPALAYLASDANSLVLSNLLFIANKSFTEATLVLMCPISLDGFEEEQTIALQYDADNLVTDATCIGLADIPLPQTRLNLISRRGRTEIRNLSLTLKSCCPVWGPLSGSIAPKSGTEVAFRQLAALVKATEICITFDYSWLRRERRDMLQQLLRAPEHFSGYDISRHHMATFRRIDTSVFTILDHVPTHADNDTTTTEDKEPLPSVFAVLDHVPTDTENDTTTTEDEEPPPYMGRSTAPSPWDIPPSPTEKNTSSPPSRQLSRVPADITPEMEMAIDKAVRKLFFVGSSSSSSSSSSSTSPLPSASAGTTSSSHTTIGPPPPALSDFGKLLSADVSCQIQEKVKDLYDYAVGHASSIRDRADTEFLEVVKDHNIDLVLTKDAGIDELARESVDKLHMFKEHCNAELEEVDKHLQQKLNEVYDDVSTKAEALLERGRTRLFNIELEMKMKRENLERDTKWLGWEKEVFRRDKQMFEDEKKDAEGTRYVKRGARAKSVPL